MNRLVLSLCGALVVAGCSNEEPAPAPHRSASADAHGFGDKIPWEPFDGALAHAKRDGMPVMLVVHASWCKRCKELKPAFSDAEIEALSQRFVMVNADQDLEPKVLEYAPDGDYIPRVVFLSPEGIEDLTLTNEARQRHRFFYTPGDDLAGVMRKALSRHERNPPPT
ncbi:MAG: thioredoxin family protein [Nannocystaceae bacterium]|nr:thioredoxin family protein [bacterium]